MPHPLGGGFRDPALAALPRQEQRAFTASWRHKDPTPSHVSDHGDQTPGAIPDHYLYDEHYKQSLSSHFQIVTYWREKNPRNLHRLWLGRGTHFHHLVCNLKEERKVTIQQGKNIPQLPYPPSMGYEQAQESHQKRPCRRHQPRPGRAQAQRGPPGHQEAIKLV